MKAISRNGAVTRGKILFVDDDPNILSALKREILFSDIQSAAARNAGEALQMLMQQDFDIIVSDYRMAGVDGMQLLKQVKEKFPSVYRIIFSGFIDHNILMRSLTHGWASIFFTKPWKSETLVKKLEQVLKIKSEIRDAEIFRLLNTFNDFPTLSSQYNKLMHAVGQKLPAHKFLEFIEVDPVLSTRVLQIANATCFGEKEIVSVKEAVELIHEFALDDIAFTTRDLREMHLEKNSVSALTNLFIHSALLNKYLPVFHKLKFGSPGPAQYPSLGIIHELGKIILLHFFPEQIQAVHAYQTEHPEKSFYECEAELGYRDRSHIQLGCWLLGLWNIPESMSDVLLAQSNKRCADSSVSNRVRVLDYTEEIIRIVYKLKKCSRGNALQLKISGIDQQTTDKIVEDMSAAIDALEAEFSGNTSCRVET